MKRFDLECVIYYYCEKRIFMHSIYMTQPTAYQVHMRTWILNIDKVKYNHTFFEELFWQFPVLQEKESKSAHADIRDRGRLCKGLNFEVWWPGLDVGTAHRVGSNPAYNPLPPINQPLSGYQTVSSVATCGTMGIMNRCLHNGTRILREQQCNRHLNWPWGSEVWRANDNQIWPLIYYDHSSHHK